jgi:hypothetical protein
VVRWDHFSLWRWVFEYVPGCSSLRGLGRVATFLALPASMGLSWVCQRAGDRAAGLSAADRRRFLTVLFIFGLLALVEQSSPPPNTGFSGSSEWKYLTHFAQGIPRDCEAFYLRVPSQAFGSTTEWSLDAAWAALLSGVPTLHGYSGGEPPGWDLVKIKRASFRGLAEDWVQRNHLKGPVCEVAILGPAVDHVGP